MATHICSGVLSISYLVFRAGESVFCVWCYSLLYRPSR